MRDKSETSALELGTPACVCVCGFLSTYLQKVMDCLNINCILLRYCWHTDIFHYWVCWRCYWAAVWRRACQYSTLPLSPLALSSPSLSNKILGCCQVAACQGQECYSAVASFFFLLFVFSSSRSCSIMCRLRIYQDLILICSWTWSMFFQTAHICDIWIEIQFRVIHASERSFQVLKWSRSSDVNKLTFKQQRPCLKDTWGQLDLIQNGS